MYLNLIFLSLKSPQLVFYWILLVEYMKHMSVKNNGMDIIIPIPQSYKDCLTLVRSDYFRYVGHGDSMLKCI